MIRTGTGETNLFQVFTSPRGVYRLTITCRAAAGSELAQMPLSVFCGSDLIGSVQLTGKDREDRSFDFTLPPAFLGSCYLRLFFGQSGLAVSRAELQVVQDMEAEFRKIRESM